VLAIQAFICVQVGRIRLDQLVIRGWIGHELKRRRDQQSRSGGRWGSP
jgi:hypothetical protein